MHVVKRLLVVGQLQRLLAGLLQRLQVLLRLALRRGAALLRLAHGAVELEPRPARQARGLGTRLVRVRRGRHRSGGAKPRQPLGEQLRGEHLVDVLAGLLRDGAGLLELAGQHRCRRGTSGAEVDAERLHHPAHALHGVRQEREDVRR